ncbi:MAG TPA: hypothetical protein ENF24_01470 [Methanosarcinales archaeon]|nr:hypothetical protein [Methanosarcinales archaeon]
MSSTLVVVVVNGYDYMIGSRTFLRAMLGAVVLAVLLTGMAAGVGAGAEWDVYPGEGTPIRGRDLRRRGYELCARGTNAHECGCGDGAGVRTADTKILM